MYTYVCTHTYGIMLFVEIGNWVTNVRKITQIWSSFCFLSTVVLHTHLRGSDSNRAPRGTIVVSRLCACHCMTFASKVCSQRQNET